MRFLPRLGGWAAELVLVFIGVYAAFWLNNFQQRQYEAERARPDPGFDRANAAGGNRERKN
jgi:hypothetical protein